MLSTLITVVQVLAWCGILIGAFLRGTRAHGSLSGAAEGVGWVAWAAASLVSSQESAHAQYNCTLYGADCVDSDAEFRSFLWQNLLRGMVIDVALGVVTDLLGWAGGRFWGRHRSLPGPT